MDLGSDVSGVCSTLLDWQISLEEQKNLLQDELMDLRYYFWEPLGVVSNIEIYW